MTLTPGLEQITEAYRQRPGAGLAAGLTVEAALGHIARHYHRSDERAERAAQAVFMTPFPAQAYTVTGGVPGVPTTIADAIAPKDGWTWFATRLSVDGLVPGTGTAAWNEGAVNSPAANTTIVQITAANLAPGNYLAYFNLSLAGTLAAADGNNMQFSGPGTGGSKIFPFPPQAGEYSYGPVAITVPAVNGTPLKIQAVGLATAGAIYGASIDIVPQPVDAVQLYRGPALAIAAAPQNRIHTFTAGGSPGPGPDWTPGGRGLLLNHQDALILAGSGLAAAQLVLSGDVLCMENWVVPRYLAGIG